MKLNEKEIKKIEEIIGLKCVYLPDENNAYTFRNHRAGLTLTISLDLKKIHLMNYEDVNKTVNIPTKWLMPLAQVISEDNNELDLFEEAYKSKKDKWWIEFDESNEKNCKRELAWLKIRHQYFKKYNGSWWKIREDKKIEVLEKLINSGRIGNE